MKSIARLALIVTVTFASAQQNPKSPSAQDLQNQLDSIKAEIAQGKQSPRVAKSASAHSKKVASPQAAQDVAQAMRVAKFMALYPTSAADDRAAEAALLNGWEANQNNYGTIKNVYRQIQNCSSDMLPSAHLRENLWQVVGPGFLTMKAGEPDPVITLILKYNPIVVHVKGKFVTKAAVQDVLAARTLVAKAAGIPLSTKSEADVVSEGTREVARTFANLPADEQDALVRGESRYQSLTRLLHSGGQSQANALALIKQARSGSDLPRIAKLVEDQSTAFVVQQNKSLDRLIQQNNQIMRMGLLANQFTALSARGFH